MNSRETMNKQLEIDRRQLEIDRRELEIDRRESELTKEAAAAAVAAAKKEEEKQFLIEYEEKKTLLLDEMQRKKLDAVAAENYELAISIRDEIDFIEKDGMTTAAWLRRHIPRSTATTLPSTVVLKHINTARQFLSITTPQCSSIDLRPGALQRRREQIRVDRKAPDHLTEREAHVTAREAQVTVREDTMSSRGWHMFDQDVEGVWFDTDSVNGTCNNKLSVWYGKTGKEISDKWDHSDKKHPFVHWCRCVSKGVFMDVYTKS